MVTLIFLSQLALQAQQDGVVKLVAGGVIANSDKQVLLLHRKAHDFMPGIYELPSGQIEQDETIEQGLKREVVEETGLEVADILDYLGHFDYTSQSGKKTRQFNFCITTDRISDVQLTEHDNFIWCSLDQLDSCNVTPQTRDVLNRYFERVK